MSQGALADLDISQTMSKNDCVSETMASDVDSCTTINTVFALISRLPSFVTESELLCYLKMCHVDMRTVRGMAFVEEFQSEDSFEKLAYVWLREPREVEWLVVRIHGRTLIADELYVNKTCLVHGHPLCRWAESTHVGIPLHAEPISAAKWVQDLGRAAAETYSEQFPRESLVALSDWGSNDL